MRQPEPSNAATARRVMTVAEIAEFLGVTEPSVWKAVRCGRLPLPVYPVSRSPRWYLDEVQAALEATRQMPAQAAAARRARRVADARNAATAA